MIYLYIKIPSGEIPKTCFFKRSDFVLDTVTICVKEALKRDLSSIF